MKKYILVSSLLIMASSAEAFQCKKVVTSCAGYGSLSTDCPSGNYLACPFNPELKHCEVEADKNDFKFSLIPIEAYGWTFQNSWNEAFVMGHNYNGRSRCSSTANATKGAEIVYHEHTYSSTINYGSAYKADADWRPKQSGNEVWYTAFRSDSKLNTGSTAASGSGKLRPINYKVRGYTYTLTEPTITNSSSVKITPNLTCATLGYKHTLSQCPGSYLVCPMDPNAVLCDLQARAGEIKFSWQGADHNGWLKVNNDCYNNCTDATKSGGRSLSGLISNRGGNYSKSELASILAKVQNVNAANTKLPDYTAVYLRLTNSSTHTDYNVLDNDNVGPHTHVFTTHDYSPNDVTGKNSGHSGSTKTYSNAYSGSSYSATVTTSSNGQGEAKETRPYSFAANIFIYSGLLE